MDPLKIRNFQRSHDGQEFPHWRELEAIDAKALRARIARATGLDDSLDALSLVRQLDSMGTVVVGENAGHPGFDLRALANRLGVTPLTDVFINWYRYDQIDRMVFEDVALHFDDLWYPSSDDIDLFDETLSWFLSVAHDGVIKLVRPRRP